MGFTSGVLVHKHKFEELMVLIFKLTNNNEACIGLEKTTKQRKVDLSAAETRKEEAGFSCWPVAMETQQCFKAQRNTGSGGELQPINSCFLSLCWAYLVQRTQTQPSAPYHS